MRICLVASRPPSGQGICAYFANNAQGEGKENPPLARGRDSSYSEEISPQSHQSLCLRLQRQPKEPQQSQFSK